jgi:hypothetical protein
VEQCAFARVSGELGGPREFGAGFVQAAELGEEVATHARQEVVAPERWLRRQRIDGREASAGPNGPNPGIRGPPDHPSAVGAARAPNRR